MAENAQQDSGNLPILAGAGGTAVATAGGAASVVPDQLQPLVEGMGRLPVPRQLGVLFGLAASIALGVWLVLWSQEPDMRPLYTSLERLDSNTIINTLEANDIRYRIDHGSGALLIDSSKIHEARLKLAEAGLPSQAAAGFELLDQEQPLGTSQFMETTRYRISLEGELTRTISSIQAVRNARVHLAIPERSVFLRDQRKPSASVLLDVVPGRTVGEGEIRAIGNLVAASVPEMTLEAVTIVDQRGKLLSDFEQDPEAEAANKQLDYTSKLEGQLVERVHRMLDPIVGTGRYKAEVTADIDFTAVEQADEIYNPDLPALRSEQRLDEQRGSAGASGIPGALSNQPPAGAQAPEVAGVGGETSAGSGNGSVRTQATRNYELDRTLSYTRHQVGRVKRLSVAVVLDDKLRFDAETGERRTQTWEQAELDRLTTLVRDAVGFDATRGDSVNVINARFIDFPIDDEVIPEIPFYQQPWFFPALKQAGAILLVLVLVFAVLRPALRSLSSNSQQLRAIEERIRLEKQMAEQARRELELTESGDGVPVGLPSAKREYDKKLSAVNALVDSDAERVAQVVRKWVRESE